MYKTAHSSSRVSMKDGTLSTPFAPRPFRARPLVSTDYPVALAKEMATRREYYSLSDPHLKHYFKAKMVSGHPSWSRPSSRTSSYRSQDSNVSTKSYPPQPRPPPPQVTYQVTVKTGQAPDAGTTARAFVTLQGSKGTLKRRRLLKNSQQNKFTFLPGKSAVFKVKGRDVGELTHVTIESDGLKKMDAWFVVMVMVTNENGDKWYCPCNQWLSLFHTDCQLSRTLPAKTQLSKPPATILYTLEVHTGDVRGAGTAANVFVTLEGSKNSSSKQQVNAESFERGSVVRAELQYSADIGRVRRLTIGHDNSGFGSDWFLDQVVLYPQSDPQDKLYFKCGQWLSRTQGDGLIERTLEASAMPPSLQLPGKTYLVDVTTGAMRGAGTDANVFVTLFGENGTSGEKRLDNDPANFERGRKDLFSLRCPDLGELSKVFIRHDNSGVGPSWYLEGLVVTEEVPVNEGRRKTTQFPCDQWLEECEGCGGDLGVELFPEGSQERRKKTLNATHKYRVTVTTGDRPGAGTTAGVYIVLCGGPRCETSKKLWLDNGQRALLPGRRDVFVVTSSKLVSPPQSLTVAHDNTGASPGWFLEEIRVSCDSSGGEWSFPCHQWLCSDIGDGRTERELHPLAPNTPTSDHTLPWEIKVFTSDLRGAGTDANVTLQVHGDKGSSNPFPLGDNIANFERGECDVFRGVLIPASIGRRVEGVTVSHDGTNPYPEWHLERVELVCARTQQVYHCQCGRWLSEENGNSVRLTAVPVHMPSITLTCPQEDAVHGNLPWEDADLPQEDTVYGDLPREDAINRDHPREDACLPQEDADLLPGDAVSQGKHRNIPTLAISTPTTDHTHPRLINDLTPITNGHAHPHTNDDSSPVTTNRHAKLTLRNGHVPTPTSSHHSPLTNGHLSPLSLSRPKTIPYTVCVVGRATPASSPAPFLELVLCSKEGDSSLPIPLQPLGTRPSPGTPETYSVEGANIGDIAQIRVKLVGGVAGDSWFISEIIIHSPTSGHTHYFPLGYEVEVGGEECTVGVAEVLESSYDTSTAVTTPRTAVTTPRTASVSASDLVAYELKVCTSDKKNAGTPHSLYLVVVGNTLSSKLFHLKNSSRHPILQRGQTDVVQIATRPLGELRSVKVAHCPRRRHQEAANAESAQRDSHGNINWHLFQVVLTSLADSRTRFTFLCRNWVEPSPSFRELKFTEIPLSNTTIAS